MYYLLTMAIFGGLMFWTIREGGRLPAGGGVAVATGGGTAGFFETLYENSRHPLALLLGQIITILLIARLTGWLFSAMRQPRVMGEMVAGILLGPSFFGLFFPDFHQVLFPPASLGNLQFLSQVGLILFMFVIGMELDLDILHSRAKDAVVISHASIVFPFALGMILAFYLFESFAPAGTSFVSFALFMGIAMSITAFPVLARIVQERGITKTKLGTIALTCAAADDITAWCILAAVIAIVKAGALVNALYTVALSLGYVLTMIYLVKPGLRRIAEVNFVRKKPGGLMVAVVFIVLIASAYATEVIGIHALFGAFMAGAIMPELQGVRAKFTEKVEDLSVVLLLPLFFVFTGLRTQITLLNDAGLWLVALLIVVVAVIGKFAGSALTARFVGQSWPDSLSIGALMNTRGLMELIVLNIGYDLGVLSPEVFAMMVIMALTTTMMTGPSLDLIERFRTKKLPR